MRSLVAIAVLVAAAGSAKADRPVTDAERAKLLPAIMAQGCSGGKLEWDEDDREFEVDDAVCDGRRYDLKFDGELRLISKKPEH